MIKLASRYVWKKYDTKEEYTKIEKSGYGYLGMDVDGPVDVYSDIIINPETGELTLTGNKQTLVNDEDLVDASIYPYLSMANIRRGPNHQNINEQVGAIGTNCTHFALVTDYNDLSDKVYSARYEGSEIIKDGAINFWVPTLGKVNGGTLQGYISNASAGAYPNDG